MAIHIALVPKSKYDENWTVKINDVFYINALDFYSEYRDGVILNMENFTRLFNENQINSDMYWIQKVNVR